MTESFIEHVVPAAQGWRIITYGRNRKTGSFNLGVEDVVAWALIERTEADGSSVQVAVPMVLSEDRAHLEVADDVDELAPPGVPLSYYREHAPRWWAQRDADREAEMRDFNKALCRYLAIPRMEDELTMDALEGQVAGLDRGVHPVLPVSHRIEMIMRQLGYVLEIRRRGDLAGAVFRRMN